MPSGAARYSGATVTSGPSRRSALTLKDQRQRSRPASPSSEMIEQLKALKDQGYYEGA
jgi:hypothetical protein